MNSINPGLTAEAKVAMIANLQLELDARKEKLQAQCDAQCASLQSRLERRVNRIPPTKRQLPLTELLNAALPASSTSTKTVPTKKAAAPANTARKTRAAPATTTTTTSKAVTPKEAPKAAPKRAPTKPTIKATLTKETNSTRAKKRTSDELSSEDKENAELAVPKKRARAATVPKAPAVSKPAARATRAASRSKTTQVLSPKNDNARQKPAARSARPR